MFVPILFTRLIQAVLASSKSSSPQPHLQHKSRNKLSHLNPQCRFSATNPWPKSLPINTCKHRQKRGGNCTTKTCNTEALSQHESESNPHTNQRRRQPHINPLTNRHGINRRNLKPPPIRQRYKGTSSFFHHCFRSRLCYSLSRGFKTRNKIRSEK